MHGAGRGFGPHCGPTLLPTKMSPSPIFASGLVVPVERVTGIEPALSGWESVPSGPLCRLISGPVVAYQERRKTSVSKSPSPDIAAPASSSNRPSTTRPVS